MKNTVWEIVGKIRKDMESFWYNSWVHSVMDETLAAINNQLDGVENSDEVLKSDFLDKKLRTFYLKNWLVAEFFCKKMFWRDPDKKSILFESTWSIRMLDTDNNWEWYDDPYHISHLRSSVKTLTDVAKEYGQDALPVYALKKAILISTFLPITQTIPMHKLLDSIIERTGTPQFRGGYWYEGNLIWVGGSEVDENVKQKIFKMAGIDGDLDEIAQKIWCGRVDLLAGIFDELLARLILHERSEREEQIQIVVNDIKRHIRNNSLALLC